jgi:hypothetical protein
MCASRHQIEVIKEQNDVGLSAPPSQNAVTLEEIKILIHYMFELNRTAYVNTSFKLPSLVSCGVHHI